jgi:RNA polymerase sigma-70 factor (ECF subfamily)
LTAPRTEANERRLIAAAQKDPRRFAVLYEQNFDRVYAYVAGRVRNRAEAEDLTAEVFQQALAHLSRFEWRGVPFRAWLLRIAANALADHWQRAVRERGSPLPADPEALRPEEVEARARLFRLVRRLPPAQRRVIVLRFVEERSIREIAEALRRTEGAVKQLQFRALANLRARLRNANG